jgi:hypothetical protein
MNQVANRSASNVAVLQGLKKSIANVKATLVKKGGEPFLRLLKSGEWVYGQDDVEVEAGSAWAINPLSIMHGWVAWERGEEADNSKGPEQDIMVPAHLPMPAADSLPKLVRAQRYEQQFSFSMVCLTGEDKGEQVLYKTASVGGVAEVDKVLNAISAQLDEDPENPVPVVVLDVDSYNHKKYKKTFTPVFTIKTWKPMSDDLPDVQAELDQQEAEAPEPVVEEKPKRTRGKSVPTTAGKATQTAADEDPELAALEAAIAAKKAQKDKAVQGTVAVDPAELEKAKRRAELQAQLEALGGDDEDEENGPVEDVPSTAPAGEPLRRRRNA